MTIEETIVKLNNLPRQIADFAVQAMQNEVPKRTGKLASSIHAEVVSENTVSIVADAEYANIVWKGRKEVKPVNARVLHWNDWPGGGDVFSMRAKETEPNDFVERTVKRIREHQFNL